jgi:hypothetical protein
MVQFLGSITLEQGLQAAGIRLRASKFALKESDPRKWRQYLLGVWSRKQGQPEVADLYQSKLLIARQLLQRWVEEHAELKLPVTFDNWYTQPAFCRFLDQELELPYVGTLAGNDQVILLYLWVLEFGAQNYTKRRIWQANASKTIASSEKLAHSGSLEPINSSKSTILTNP